jgi:hypothetical protein
MQSRSFMWMAAAFAAIACGGAPGKSTTPADDSDKGLGEYAASKGGLASLNGGSTSPASVPDGLHLDLVEKERPVKLDGVLLEWPARAAAKQAIKGSTKSSMTIAVQYDDGRLYIGGEVFDEKLVRTDKFGDGEDHASLVLAFPTASGALVAYELGLYAGKPGESAGSVRFVSGSRKGRAIDGAKIVEAPIDKGYSFEASVPWASMPEARLVRVGLRGAARYYDADTVGQISAILATGAGDTSTPSALPPLPDEAEQSMIEQLLSPKALADQPPKFEAIADVGGDAMKERIAVFGPYLVVAGPGYLGGNKFFFKDTAGEVTGLDVRDVTARGKADILLRRRRQVSSSGSSATGATRESFEVLSVFGDSEPQTTFAHEIAVSADGKKIVNSVHAAAKDIEVAIEPGGGWDASTYREPIASDMEPILFPWGAVRSQTFHFDGKTFVKSKEVAKPESGSAAPSSAPRAPPSIHPQEPPTPRVKSGGDLAQQVFEQYKKDRGVSDGTKPRVDLQVQVQGDARPERVVLIGRDIVVFGPGFKGGTSYAYITLSQFADAADVLDLSARDLTGDGAADLVVRGVMRRNASGSPDPVELDVLFIYEIRGESLSRIFAIETGREQAKKRIQGLVQIIPAEGGKGFDVDVQPGRATGWTEKTYPWTQEQPGAGALEPVLLPWGGIAHLRYSYNGTQYAKR